MAKMSLIDINLFGIIERYLYNFNDTIHIESYILDSS